MSSKIDNGLFSYLLHFSPQPFNIQDTVAAALFHSPSDMNHFSLHDWDAMIEDGEDLASLYKIFNVNLSDAKPTHSKTRHGVVDEKNLGAIDHRITVLDEAGANQASKSEVTTVTTKRAGHGGANSMKDLQAKARAINETKFDSERVVTPFLKVALVDRSTLPDVMIQILHTNSNFGPAWKGNIELPLFLRLPISFQAVINPAVHATLMEICNLTIHVCKQAQDYFDVIDQRYEEVFDLELSKLVERSFESSNSGLPHSIHAAQTEMETADDDNGDNGASINKIESTDPDMLWLSGTGLCKYERWLRAKKY